MTRSQPDRSGPQRASQDETARYARTLLEDCREELVRADSKCALLLAASGVAIGALLNGLISAKWSPLQLRAEVGWLWWLGVLAAAGAVACLAVAVFPRTKRSGDQPTLVAFYGDVVALGRENLDANLAVTATRLRSVLLDQIHAISVIADRKYRLLRAAILLFGLAASGCAGAVLMDLVLR